MSNHQLPLLQSPERPEPVIPLLRSTATTVIARPITPIAKTLAPISPKCILKPRSKELVLRKRGFARCDVANGSVTETEIRRGYSLRTRTDPLWLLDINYVKHLRTQQGLSSLTGSRNDDLVTTAAVNEGGVTKLKYEPLFPLHLYRSKSTIVQLFADDPYLQQQGRDSLEELITLSRRDDTQWMWHLSVDLSPNEHYADVVLGAFGVHTSSQTLYRNDGTYISFMANATITYGDCPTICSPFLFVASSKLGKKVYSSLDENNTELTLHCHSYAARLTGDSISSIPEVFYIQSIVS